jgi:hypothetical protein
MKQQNSSAQYLPRIGEVYVDFIILTSPEAPISLREHSFVLTRFSLDCFLLKGVWSTFSVSSWSSLRLAQTVPIHALVPPYVQHARRGLSLFRRAD